MLAVMVWFDMMSQTRSERYTEYQDTALAITESQKVKPLHLMINETITDFNFLGLTLDEKLS